MTRRRMPVVILKCCVRLVPMHFPQPLVDFPSIHGRTGCNDKPQQGQKRTATWGRYCLPTYFNRFVPGYVFNH